MQGNIITTAIHKPANASSKKHMQAIENRKAAHPNSVPVVSSQFHLHCPQRLIITTRAPNNV